MATRIWRGDGSRRREAVRTTPGGPSTFRWEPETTPPISRLSAPPWPTNGWSATPRGSALLPTETNPGTGNSILPDFRPAPDQPSRRRPPVLPRSPPEVRFISLFMLRPRGARSPLHLRPKSPSLACPASLPQRKKHCALLRCLRPDALLTSAD